MDDIHYYTIDKYGVHRIMRYHKEARFTGGNWEGDWGEHSWKKNEDIEKWTDLLPM